jgi:hypothetical protein
VLVNELVSLNEEPANCSNHGVYGHTWWSIQVRVSPVWHTGTANASDLTVLVFVPGWKCRCYNFWMDFQEVSLLYLSEAETAEEAWRWC